MPAKGQKLPVSQLGNVQRGDGRHVRFRVVAKLETFLQIYGPYRECQRAAEDDLKQARTARTRDEYRDIIRQLQKTAQSDRAKAKAKAQEETRTLIKMTKATKVKDKGKAKAHAQETKAAKAARTTKAIRDGWQRRQRRYGTITRCNNGWRVSAAPMGRLIYGPFRVHKVKADADLEKARRAHTSEDFCAVIRRLQKRVRIRLGPYVDDGPKQIRTTKTREEYRKKKTFVQVYGPQCVCQREAEDDLNQAYAEQTRDEYRDSIRQLQNITQSDGAEAKAKAQVELTSKAIRHGWQRRRMRYGTITAHGNGWRVTAAPMGRLIAGPFRARKAKAYADLEKIRRADTPEDFCDAIRQLQKRARIILGPYADDGPKQTHATKTPEECRSILGVPAEDDHQIRKQECAKSVEIRDARSQAESQM